MRPEEAELREFIRRLNAAEADARRHRRELAALAQDLADLWNERGAIPNNPPTAVTPPPTTGTVTVTCWGEAGAAVSGATVKLFSGTATLVGTATSDASGNASFTFTPGATTYYVTATKTAKTAYDSHAGLSSGVTIAAGATVHFDALLYAFASKPKILDSFYSSYGQASLTWDSSNGWWRGGLSGVLSGGCGACPVATTFLTWTLRNNAPLTLTLEYGVDVGACPGTGSAGTAAIAYGAASGAAYSPHLSATLATAAGDPNAPYLYCPGTSATAALTGP